MTREIVYYNGQGVKRQYQNYIMSYRKQPSGRQQLANPQTAYHHIQRMQGLLEQYDRENQHLNKQVLQLLDRKHVLETKYSIAAYKDSAKQKNQSKVGEKSGRSTKDLFFRDQRESRNRRKKYEYVDDEDRDNTSLLTLQNNYQVTEQRSGHKTRTKYQYTPVDNLPSSSYSHKYQSNERNNRNTVSPKPFVPVSEWTSTKNSRILNNQDKKQKYPEASSRFVSEEQLKRKNNEKKKTDQSNQSTKLQRQQSINLVPILKRQPYIRSPQNNSISLSNSPERRNSQSPGKQINLNDSKLSGKSSRKSGIHVTTSTKNLLQEEKIRNSKIQESRKQQKEDQQNRNVFSPNKSAKRVSFTDEKLPQRLSESIMRPESKELIFKTQSKTEQPKKKSQVQPKHVNNLIEPKQSEQLIETATFKSLNLSEVRKKQQFHPISIIPKTYEVRPYSIYRQMGVNTSPKEAPTLVKHRSISQHRILPSQKISYGQQSQLKRKESQPHLRNNSRDTKQGKKKFLNLVSTSLLVKKLNQHQKLNDVYK